MVVTGLSYAYHVKKKFSYFRKNFTTNLNYLLQIVIVMKKDLQVKVVMMILVGVYANHMSLEPDVIGVTMGTMVGLIVNVSFFLPMKYFSDGLSQKKSSLSESES